MGNGNSRDSTDGPAETAAQDSAGVAPRKEITPVEMEDLWKRTHFTEMEVKQWYQKFLKMYPEGQVTCDQFQQLYSQQFPQGDAKEFAQHVFRTFDKDMDELLDFREFMAAMNIIVRGSTDERLRWAFQVYDIRQNGFIYRDECIQIFKAMCRVHLKIHPMSREEMDQKARATTEHVFATVDKNKDNRLSMKEFIQGARSEKALIKFLDM